jgi:hypothetical protein
MHRAFFLLLTVFFSAPDVANAGGGGKVAVLDIHTTSINPDYVEILTEILSTEIEATGHYDSVIAGRDIATMMGFEKQRDLVGCNDTECLVELGGALGVDRIIAGHVAKIGKSYIVQIKLINIVTQQPERRIYETVKGTEDVLVTTIKECVAKLVSVNSAASSNATASSNSSEPTLSHGRQSIAVGKNRPTNIVPWVLLGLGATGMGAGVYFGLEAREHEKNSDPGIPGSQKATQDSKSSALLANVSYGLGIVSSAVGLAFWMMPSTDAQTHVQINVVPSQEGLAVTLGGQF